MRLLVSLKSNLLRCTVIWTWNWFTYFVENTLQHSSYWSLRADQLAGYGSNVIEFTPLYSEKNIRNCISQSNTAVFLGNFAKLRKATIKMTRRTNLMQQLWFILISSLYMFRTSICPSSGVFYIQVVYCCMWCSALGVVAVVLRSRCVVLCTVCELVNNLYIKKTPEHGHIDVRNM